jgi:hypothetical protein
LPQDLSTPNFTCHEVVRQPISQRVNTLPNDREKKAMLAGSCTNSTNVSTGWFIVFSLLATMHQSLQNTNTGNTV